MRNALAVRLTSGQEDLSITNLIEDLTLNSTSPGGFAGGTMTFHRPLNASALPSLTTVLVYDSQTGEQVGGGRLTDPGRTADENGQVWSLTFIGEGPAHTADQTIPLGYIDQDLSNWFPYFLTTGTSEAEVGTAPGSAASALAMTFPPNTAIANGFRVSMIYRIAADSYQTIGGFNASHIEGIASTDMRFQTLTETLAVGSPAVARDDPWTTTGTTLGTGTATLVGTHFPAGDDTIFFRLYRATGGAIITSQSDTWWSAAQSVRVTMRRIGGDGHRDNNPADYQQEYVLASDCIIDLLWRMLPRFDAAAVAAVIVPTTNHIDQLTWWDGVTAGQVLDDLMTIENLYTWHVWEKKSNGLYNFEWVPWPNAVRYDATVLDGFDSPSPSTDLYNQVYVRGKDFRGRTQSTLATLDVPQLDDAGLIRIGYVDLGDEVWSSANAAIVGANFLADHALTPNTGTLTIARPIFDLVSGRWVQPWNIRPGQLIRVRGIRPNPDGINTGRDGVTTFRIVSTSFSDSSSSVEIELDSYTPSETRLLANLYRTRTRKA